MRNRLSLACAVMLAAGTLGFLAKANDQPETWKGWVTDTSCGMSRETKPPSVECTTRCLQNKGAKYALYDVVNKKLYVLNPQEQAAKYSAKMVVVTGTFGKDTEVTTSEGKVSRRTIDAASISVVPEAPK